MKVVIIGAGINGLMTAWHLIDAGHDVTILEKNDGSDNCSYGNAGYICPSHFIQLATPGIINQGLKWMLQSDSPFYIQPRLSWDLLKWGWLFKKSARLETVNKNARPLLDLLILSREIYIQIDNELNHAFELKQEGCLMIYNSEKYRKKELEMAEMANKFGIKTEELSPAALNELEPEMGINALGAVNYPIDCHLNPAAMMKSMTQALIERGVKIHYNQNILHSTTSKTKLLSITTQSGQYNFDKLIIAAGSWTPIVASQLTGYKILLQPGKGYSITYKNPERKLRHSAILADYKVALTPMGDGFRVGGTMELSGINQSIKMNRVNAIITAANTVFPKINLNEPLASEVWSGLRPCSPDGLPYIDHIPGHPNILITAGHAMIGVAAAAATGKLVAEMVDENLKSMDIKAFRLSRFD